MNKTPDIYTTPYMPDGRSLLPQLHPDIVPLISASSMITLPQVDVLCLEREITVQPSDVADIMAIMTPNYILEQPEHDREIITTGAYPTFNVLRDQRDRIRDLRLVPRRGPVAQKEYEQIDKTKFLSLVEAHYLNGHHLSFVRELYPSELPGDVSQFVAWFNEHMVDERVVAEFIAKIIRLTGKSVDDVILFERSRVTNTDYVKVAIPEYRHIHIWTRSRGNEIITV